MPAGENRKQQELLTALREKLNTAERKKNYPAAVEACLDIIALDARDKTLNILAFLYHKDLGHAYLRLLEYEKAVASLKTAREGLLQHRATKKLKYEDEWINELNALEKLIHRIEKTHLS